FSAFASANEPRITPVEKSSSLVARAGTCPSGTYACADKEGGCCSDGTSCLPNFQCSGSGKSSGATSTTSSGYFVFPLFQFSNIASTINKLTHTRNELQYSGKNYTEKAEVLKESNLFNEDELEDDDYTI
ncbi:493_t:CDS:2, partial [Rhizophagus irregularis]